MAFETIIAEINFMFDQMDSKPEDAHELLDRIHLELSQLKASGMPLPEDLVMLEKKLDAEFERRGRTRNGD
jgi:hypothetical protein